MTTPWTDALALVVVQHLWLSALCFLLSGLVRRSHRLGAVARSTLSLCLVTLAAVLPLAVFVPGERPVEVASTGASTHEVIDVAPPSPLETAVAPASTAVTRDAALEALAIGVWLVGFAWCLHRLLLGRHEAGRLRDTASAAPALEHLLARDGADRATIRISDQVHAPMVVGVRRPCILVPRNLVTELPEEMLLGLLRHEMAHIRRCDLWITLGQRLGQAAYWWSPLFRLLGARLDLAREMACDAEAAARSGGGRSYAQAPDLRGAARAGSTRGAVRRHARDRAEPAHRRAAAHGRCAAGFRCRPRPGPRRVDGGGRGAGAGGDAARAVVLLQAGHDHRERRGPAGSREARPGR